MQSRLSRRFAFVLVHNRCHSTVPSHKNHRRLSRTSVRSRLSTVVVGSTLIRRSPNRSVCERVHSSFAANRATIARFARQIAHDAVLIAERVREDVDVASEQLAELSARASQLIARIVDRDVDQRPMRDAVRSEAHALVLKRQDSCSRREEEARSRRSPTRYVRRFARDEEHGGVHAAGAERRPRVRVEARVPVVERDDQGLVGEIRGRARVSSVEPLREADRAIAPREQRVQLPVELGRLDVVAWMSYPVLELIDLVVHQDRELHAFGD